jgi:hypothetical protein
MIGRFLRLAGSAVGALLILTGCGGGGGGGDDNGPGPSGGFPLTITVTQNPITASVMQIDLSSSTQPERSPEHRP